MFFEELKVALNRIVNKAILIARHPIDSNMNLCFSNTASLQQFFFHFALMCKDNAVME